MPDWKENNEKLELLRKKLVLEEAKREFKDGGE